MVYRLSGDQLIRMTVTPAEQAADGTYNDCFRGAEDANQIQTFLVYTNDVVMTPEILPGRAQTDITSVDYDTNKDVLLIVSHPNFMGALQPLVDARRSQGFAVKMVDVNDVYSQFGYGIFGPDAIRAYIAYAAQNMSVDHVLLGGGDSLDYLNYAGTGSRSFIHLSTSAIRQPGLPW